MSDSTNTSRARKSVPVFRLLMGLALILIIILIIGSQINSWLSAPLQTEDTRQLKPASHKRVMSTSHSAETRHGPGSPDKKQVPASDSAQASFPFDTGHLLLVGVVLSSDKLGSIAIIEYRGHQNGYSIGDRVYHHQILLTQITKESAVIQYQQNSHTLYLQKSTSRPGLSIASKENAPPSEKGDSGAPDFGQYIAVTPVYEQGIPNGLLATPKGDSNVFLKLGLMSEDVITEINGVSMTSSEGLERADALLQTPGPLQLSIRRQGQVMTVLVDPPQGFL
ncbi:type II secretion system protein N [Lacimicrobium alkaliphilum]|uniref:Type II secretion system protein GspC N-terminal domain-containing protein n=1 Tax=Lacimicrobium alkaliphilum TaxID=1526571 RepID=A0ABQ1RAC6_9ALTE|nr:type II secretion system protein N [Lacimicrobium alkaliphilum]GGD63087.1 hypothetical protein GCM10011357_17960 [Lacimicrobium alkaliphilum]